ncbi:MAG: YjbQ family protein [Anaerolineaceae bacterium]|nr:YjbQ family protein [Anaerolineaceae bacterium]
MDMKLMEFSTTGNFDILDLTDQVAQIVLDSGVKDGVVTLFSPSSTSGFTTIEYESGCVADLRRTFQELVPEQREYAHNARWGDGNGHSHIRSSLLGTSFTIPIVKSRLFLGTWQQVIFVEFDNKPRRRQVGVQIIEQSQTDGAA